MPRGRSEARGGRACCGGMGARAGSDGEYGLADSRGLRGHRRIAGKWARHVSEDAAMGWSAGV